MPAAAMPLMPLLDAAMFRLRLAAIDRRADAAPLFR